MKYGIEFEFFVKKGEDFIPAYLATNNLDGNPVVGELKTSIHNSLVDCVFDLKKMIYNEEKELAKKGYTMVVVSSIMVNDSFKISLRKDAAFINKKDMEILEEFSIYPNGRVGKILPAKLYKASLQINFSDNRDFNYTEYRKVTVEDKYKYDTETKSKSYSSLFNYVAPIYTLDLAFAGEIQETNRVKGVYAIKKGELGDRIEYRSLPNTISLDKLMEVKL